MNEAMQLILSELQGKPADYTGKTDHEVADVINARTRTVWKAVEARRFLGALAAEEVAQIQDQAADETAKAHAAAAAVDYYLSMIGEVDIQPGTATRGWIDVLVTEQAMSAATLAKLETAAQSTVPVLSTPANHGDVAWVRREVLKEKPVNG